MTVAPHVLELALADLPHGQPVPHSVGGRPVIVVRIDGDVFAVDGRCTHLDLPLVNGFVYADSREIECRHHGSSFSLDTGRPDAPPARAPLACHPVSVRDGRVRIEVQADVPVARGEPPEGRP